MLLDRRTWHLHRPWLALTFGVTAAAGFWYGITGLLQHRLPGGSSLPGLAFGVAGALMILFECFLWVRKKVRVWRLGTAQEWMRAHIWIGLLCLPLLVLHSGFHWGGTLSSILLALLIIVIASGIWGLALQQFLPARLLRDAPPESVYEEIDHLATVLLTEADDLMRLAAGIMPEPSSASALGAATTLGVGVARPVTPPRQPSRAATTSDISLEVEALSEFFHKQVRPYLAGTARGRGRFGSPYQMAAQFEFVRYRIDVTLHSTLDALQRLCEQRRLLDVQARLHFWLHNWLWVHLPLSGALVILMVVHAWAAVMYW